MKRLLARLLFLPGIRRLPWPFSWLRKKLWWKHPGHLQDLYDMIYHLQPADGPFMRLLKAHNAKKVHHEAPDWLKEDIARETPGQPKEPTGRNEMTPE